MKNRCPQPSGAGSTSLLTNAVSRRGHVEARLAAQDATVGARAVLTPPGPTRRVSRVLTLVNICPQSRGKGRKWPSHCSDPTSLALQGHVPQALGSLICSKLLCRSQPQNSKFRVVSPGPGGLSIWEESSLLLRKALSSRPPLTLLLPLPFLYGRALSISLHVTPPKCLRERCLHPCLPCSVLGLSITVPLPQQKTLSPDGV